MIFSSVDLPRSLKGFETLVVVVCPYFGISVLSSLVSNTSDLCLSNCGPWSSC